MKKIFFLMLLAIISLASCSNDVLIEDTPKTGGTSPIVFNSKTEVTTRATSNTGSIHTMLDDQFLVYGVKTTETNKYTDVFNSYDVWYVDNTANTSATNTNNWEYVADANTVVLKDASNNALLTISSNPQTIKYWDYASTEYHFVAGSPVANFSYTLDETTKDIKSATVKGLAGHINPNTSGTGIVTNPVYIAKPKVITSTDYTKVVKFEFVRQQTMVRVGVYETIPGYDITEIHFYTQGSTKAETNSNIILQSGTDKYFVGGTASSGTITYDWATPAYTFAYDNTGLTTAKNWYGGSLSGTDFKLAETSTSSKANLYGTDDDMASDGYFTVIPTPSATDASPILIKCDYTLKSNDSRSGETIKVTGATAAIPAAFCKWDTNTKYTYLFKISDNTNGYTGDQTDKAGLYPITFDAAVIDATEATQGTITTVTTPSVTTYQEGSVTTEGIKYSTGNPIYFTVEDNTNGVLNTLTNGGTEVGNVEVYKLTKERTEAELQVSSIFKTEITDNSSNKQTVTIDASNDKTVGTVTLTKSKYASFKPTASGYYVIQYLMTKATATEPAVYTYKIVHVE